MTCKERLRRLDQYALEVRRTRGNIIETQTVRPRGELTGWVLGQLEHCHMESVKGAAHIQEDFGSGVGLSQ